jgi:hypothetical protein
MTLTYIHFNTGVINRTKVKRPKMGKVFGSRPLSSSDMAMFWGGRTALRGGFGKVGSALGYNFEKWGACAGFGNFGQWQR